MAAVVDDPAEAPTRAGLVATQMLGRALCRHILRLPPVAALDVETLVARVSETVQRYLTGPLSSQRLRVPAPPRPARHIFPRPRGHRVGSGDVASSKVISSAAAGPLAEDLSPAEAVGVLRSLVANVPGAIYRVALEDGLSLRLIGAEIERITGYPPDDFIDGATRTLFSIVHPDDRQWVEVELRAVRPPDATRRSLTIEYRIVRADGAVRWVLERGTTALDEQGRVCLDGVVFDVTERREAEQRLRRQEAEAAQAREVRASRTRIVESADEARRRLERDLHDGAQQRFVSAALMLQIAKRRLGGASAEVAELLDRVSGDLDAGLADLRELAHGIHPAVLTDRGLPAALESLAGRAPMTVVVEGSLSGRLQPAAETALYFAAAEALTNVAKYAAATEATVRLAEDDGHVEVAICDDGRGGASLDRGSGLRGLVDRLGAVGGRLEVASPPGGGTMVRAIVPRDLGT